jgi:hypothetical protein
METDLTSIIIGLASLATFLVPIGYYQLHEKKGLKEVKKHFLKKADDLGFQTGDIEILRNRAAIGMDKNNEELLYLHGNRFELIELTNVVHCSIFTNQKKDLDSDDGVIQQIGIHVKLQNGVGIKLLIFEGKEGTLFGDERLIAQHWIGKINSAHNEFDTTVKA